MRFFHPMARPVNQTNGGHMDRWHMESFVYPINGLWLPGSLIWSQRTICEPVSPSSSTSANPISNNEHVPASNKNDEHAVWPKPLRHTISQQQQQHTVLEKIIPQSNHHHAHMAGEESCQSCLYTGVATCFGLASYFVYLAVEDEFQATAATNGMARSIKMKDYGKLLQQAARKKPGFLLVSAGWMALGIHRWNLG